MQELKENYKDHKSNNAYALIWVQLVLIVVGLLVIFWLIKQNRRLANKKKKRIKQLVKK